MKVVLSIAGSDSSGGAGIQADIKTCEHFGVFSTTAITALTAQNTKGVQDICALNADFVYAQIESILDDFEVHAIKIGMLYNSSLIEIVQQVLSKLTIPVVLDPVFTSSSGSSLLKENAVQSLKELFANVTLITPRLEDAKILFGEELDINAPCPVLVKNIEQKPKNTDRLFYANNVSKDFSSNFESLSQVHGLASSYSSAIAANLALGKSLEQSIEIAREYLEQATLKAPNLGHDNVILRHKLD